MAQVLIDAGQLVEAAQQLARAVVAAVVYHYDFGIEVCNCS